MGEPDVCDVGEKGVILPLFGDDEQRWPDGVRIPLYFTGLMWCFMAVALIADKFMAAIEKVTTATYVKYLPNGRQIEVKCWNDTVANLTLMALGSSAPEIMLSVIELMLMNNFFNGKLGPSTIVGSAAFNLFAITAVCIYVIPRGEIRKINKVEVYIVTAIFSLFAYLWMLVILIAITPDIVDVVEGIATFLFFPILVTFAYFADRGYFSRDRKQVSEFDSLVLEKRGELTKAKAAELDNLMLRLGQRGFSAEQIKTIIDKNCIVNMSRATRRVAATRRITGGRRVEVPDAQEQEKNLLKIWARGMSGTKNLSNWRQVAPIEAEETEEVEEEDSLEKDPLYCVFDFERSREAVLESHGPVELVVRRRGNLEGTSTVRFRTEDGTAKQDSDYVAHQGKLTFGPAEAAQVVKVDIVDDEIPEGYEEFYVELFEPEGYAKLGQKAKATILIVDDDMPGEIAFPDDVVYVQEKPTDQVFPIKVERRGGGRGKISCKYVTKEGSAREGLDFEPVEGRLVFPQGTYEVFIPVTIKSRGRYQSNDYFFLSLTEATGGANFCPNPQGRKDHCQLRVEIKVSKDHQNNIDKVLSVIKDNWDHALIGHATWADQFRDAFYVNGGDEREDTSWRDWVTHILLLPWKLLFALVPPTDFCGGWACFGVSLLMIGGVTLIVGELAGLLGCVLQIGPEITAITFVALGTSLPDMFASMEAAKCDVTADASIVNVTGSNSVNVFLGLGLPWMVGALYWAAKGEQTDDWLDKYRGTRFEEECPNACFVVEAGGLAFNTSVFAMCAFVALAVLAFRRKAYNGELGGPDVQKLISSFIFASLWMVYITLSIIYILSEGDE